MVRLLIALSCILLAANVLAEERLISLEGGQQAFRFMPEGKQPPTVAGIYVHGLIVEKIGPEAAAAKGYDVAAFARAFADEGMVGIAPLRDTTGFQDAGIAAALKYLQRHSDIPSERTVIMGFSRGGALLLSYLAIQGHDGPIILMSPALRSPLSYSPATPLRAPVLITLGTRDPISLRNVVQGELLPSLRARQVVVRLIDTYQGDHRWFWEIREQHWRDVSEFIATSIKINK